VRKLIPLTTRLDHSNELPIFSQLLNTHQCDNLGEKKIMQKG